MYEIDDDYTIEEEIEELKDMLLHDNIPKFSQLELTIYARLYRLYKLLPLEKKHKKYS